MKYIPELIFYNRSSLLEGPVWDFRTKHILCVSINENCIYDIDINNGVVNTITTDGPVGCVVIKSEGILWSAEKGGIYETNTKNEIRKKLIHPVQSIDIRYNDGTLDPVGRFIFGTMGLKDDMQGCGKLFSYDGVECKIILENITISNGIAFSNDAKTMYYIDTPKRVVQQFDYDLETGEIKYVDSPIKYNDLGLPDGLCIDGNNHLWIAEWNGSKVCKWDPVSRKKLDEIQMPCKNVTSCCLGGVELEYLYITTAKSEYENEPLAGGLFRVKIK
jgi:sugar lactone lactonase YvrE